MGMTVFPSIVFLNLHLYSIVPDKNRSLLRPVVEYPHVDFCGPCFSLFAPYDFYSDHAFHFNPPAVFIQTGFFQTVASRVLL